MLGLTRLKGFEMFQRKAVNDAVLNITDCVSARIYVTLLSLRMSVIQSSIIILSFGRAIGMPDMKL